MSITLKEGDAAPDFSLQDKDGKTVSLKGLRGQRVVLYFYPKDDTPGCTIEACSFRDGFADFKKKDIVVLGVSPDDEESHTKFTQKFSLPFTLLADPNHDVATRYGAWGKKLLYGRTYLGIMRSTFLIDEDGKIIKIFPKVSPEGHAQEVLAAFGER